ncbi:hypothetical protein N9A94_00005, partial [Akkermansiaceae bacterium]|nr:hypothetical protein [Akkermansiaceae bacterium]MDA7888852.1 hypothetical protein [Akkermansiaceae bacterium]
AGRVTGGVTSDNDFEPVETTKFCKVEWLTPKPDLDALKCLPAREIKSLLGHGFFWARTVKVPYLTADESRVLVDQLNRM